MQRVNKQRLHGEEELGRAEAQGGNTLTEAAKQVT